MTTKPVFRTIGEISGRIAHRITPDPFAFAIILSVAVGLAGIVLTDNGPIDMAGYWYSGFWDLLTFSMQMVIILVAGHVLATSAPAGRLLARLSLLPRSSSQAILLISCTAIIGGFFNWAVGLVTGAVMAVTVSARARERGIKVHYPLAAASGYMGMLIFGNGFSSSAPLLSNTNDHFLIEEIGLVSLGETILMPSNLITTLIFLVTVPLLLRAMHPAPDDCQEIDPELVRAFEADVGPPTSGGGKTLVEKMERSRLVFVPMALVGLGISLWYLTIGTASLDLNSLNFLLVMAGMVLYGTPIAYMRAVERAVHTAAGVILQFPFYSGIMGMMSLSGLVEEFAGGMIAISTQATLPVTALISAGLVNFFVPSAGGQWAVQGPILIEAARALELPMGQMIMAFSYGDQLTNMVQPFWSIPLLGITALHARDLLGYTAVAMVAAFGIFVFGVAVLSPLMAAL